MQTLELTYRAVYANDGIGQLPTNHAWLKVRTIVCV